MFDFDSYGLRHRKNAVYLDLRSIYVQARPNLKLPKDIMPSPKLSDSPYFELGELAMTTHRHFFVKNWQHTRFGRMISATDEGFDPVWLANVADRVRTGDIAYGGPIIALLKPFAFTRYDREDVPLLIPEIFANHLVAGVLLAARRYVVPVIVAEDIAPHTQQSPSPLHEFCCRKS